MKHFWNWLLASMLMLLLAACGGGGGSAGTPTGSANPANFVVNAPSAITLAIGQKASFPISGGQTPYIVASSAPSVASASVGDNGLNVTALTTGTTTVRVAPTGGKASFEMNVVVVSSTVPLVVQSPDAITLSADKNVTYTVIGGVPPYRASVGAPSILRADLNGNQLTLTGLAKGATEVIVFDATNGTPVTKKVDVVEVAAFYSSAPSTFSVPVNASRSFSVGGGVAPYSVAAADESVATANIVGATLSVQGKRFGDTSLVLRDSAGSVLSLTVNVGGSSGTFFTTAPASLTMNGGSTRSFSISGGGGNYVASSSDNSVVTATVVGGNTLSLTAQQNGSTTVTIFDAKGDKLSVAITVVKGGLGSGGKVELLTDKLSIKSAGDEAIISAFVKDSGNAAVAGATVQFSASSGVLQSADATTDASGVAKVKLSAGSDKTNRTITVTASAGTQPPPPTVDVSVVGSTVAITGGSTQQLDATKQHSYSVRALDSSGNPLAGVVLQVSSTLGTVSPTSVTTNNTGSATFNYIANAAGSGSITVAGVGTTQSLAITVSPVSLVFITPAASTSVDIGTPIKVTLRYINGGIAQPGNVVNFSTTRGGITDASSVITDGNGDATVTVSSSTAGPATVTAQIPNVGAASLPLNFVAKVPTSITLQATPSAIPPNSSGGTTNQSTLTAIVRDASDNLVAGQTVTFNLEKDLSGGSLSSGTAVTDANGRAQVQFISGATSTPSNGVEVRASVSGTNVSTLHKLTVSGSALFISINFGNTINNLDPTTYIKPFTISVNDANGVPVGNQDVTISAIPLSYQKGKLVYNKDAKLWVKVSAPPPTTCSNEDKNQNGLLDAGEDNDPANGNKDGRLTPGNVVAVSPGVVKTDIAGRATFDLIYGEQYASWVIVTINARATVAGTESLTKTDFELSGSSEDYSKEDNPPASQVSPFGTSSSCTDAK